MRVVIVIGAPGTGKGTICKTLRSDTYLHLSTGDMCREEAEKKTDFGRQLRYHIRRGDFVPDDIMIEMLNNRLKEPDVSDKCVLLDGYVFAALIQVKTITSLTFFDRYPRTLEQAKRLDEAFKIERVVLLQAPDDVCLKRIKTRLVDPRTGVSYNSASDTLIPRTVAIAKRLVQRETDKDESIVRTRLQTFHFGLGPILSVFRGRIFPVNTVGSDIGELSSAFIDVLNIPIAAPIVASAALRSSAKVLIQPALQSLCVVCMENPADHIVTPCGHMCGCQSCLSTLKNMNDMRSNCPVCRGPIRDFVRVFQSGVIEEPDNNEVGVEAVVSSVPSVPSVPLSHLGGGWDSPVSPDDDNIKPTISIGTSHKLDDTRTIGITVHVPDGAPKSVDICCVIDISGSMGEDAKFQDPDDETKTVSEGMNQLDIVKHAVKTVIQTLSDVDRLSIVAFDTISEMTFELSEMNADGKARAMQALDSLQPRNSTNIWAGLECGLESLRTRPDKRNSQFLFLLTDGQPSDSPPQGEGSCLKHYFEVNPDFKCMVSMFGFGYSLKSGLMLEMAQSGGGTFAFIPDAKIVGTCFVNAVSNAKTCFSIDTKIHVCPKNKSKMTSVVDGSVAVQNVPWGNVIRIGPMHLGQSRDLSVSFADVAYDNFVDITVEFDGEKVHSNVVGSSDADSVVSFARNSVCSMISQIIDLCSRGRGQDAQAMLMIEVGKLSALEAATKDWRIAGLLNDVSGRIDKAISTNERFKRWGSHYLRAIFRSHQFQMRTNFMDPGLQVYGGRSFVSLMERGGEIFLTLPMKKYSDAQQPQQKQQKVAKGGGAQNKAMPPPPSNNSTYYGGGGGGCFGPNCSVRTLSGTKRVSTVRKGDLLEMADGGYGLVTCVIELDCHRDDMLMIGSGLMITPNHPVKIGGRWTRPWKVTGAQQYSVDRVYNFLFSQRPKCGLMVNNYECITYHHTVAELQHKFYTSDKMIATLSSYQGFSDGYVRIAKNRLERALNEQ